MRRFILLSCILLFTELPLFAQSFVPGKSYLNDKGYVEYIYGALPIIISAPHGGRLKPEDIPDRDTACGDKIVTAFDTNTQELVRALDNSLAKLFGQHPHTVIARISRKKVDMNREVKEAACGNTAAETAWRDYQGYIDSARQRVLRQYGWGLFIDIHGHGHKVQRNEIGYLLQPADLRNGEAAINRKELIARSSIRHLIDSNKAHVSQAALLTGPTAFGTLLANAGYPAVPSSLDPYPQEGEAYFNGGYNTATWGSRTGGTIDGFQIETNYKGVRDTKESIQKFADALAQSIKIYLEQNFPHYR